MHKLMIIIGSTRPQRFGPQVAKWITTEAESIVKADGNFTIDLVDLAEVNLPFLDEAMPAGFQKYTNQHTIDWSARVASADGFIFVSPEYNHSYSAPLKNALDYLAVEWAFKPLGLVTYGGHAGGVRAAEHLRSIAGELKMYDIRESVLVPHYWDYKDAEGNFVPTEDHRKSAQAMISQLIHWAKIMKTGR
jgi:NAD(P)H-dependent FMN reductase